MPTATYQKGPPQVPTPLLRGRRKYTAEIAVVSPGDPFTRRDQSDHDWFAS
jgi:hypothetical protein